MTAADKIAADLRDAFRALPAVWRGLANDAVQAVPEANDFDAVMSRALAAIMELDSAVGFADLEQRQAQARKDFVVGVRDKAREALRQALEACGEPGAATVETEHHTARLNPGGKRVEITDEKALPADCWRVKQEPDKALVKALLAKGQDIPGAALVQSPSSLVISSKDR